ncbi:hypothetical protein [Roseomonas rosulenta]|uniref:hypothetical protein n=1 Tax=Roseomonas rosulenta TaxID=2748667 RepID=UPI0018E04697|nr:hypothetical protein [Roseomonas rosulenta]
MQTACRGDAPHDPDRAIGAQHLAAANVAGFGTILVEDRAAATNPRFRHDVTILDIHQIFGVTVAPNDLAKAIAP